MIERGGVDVDLSILDKMKLLFSNILGNKPSKDKQVDFYFNKVKNNLDRITVAYKDKYTITINEDTSKDPYIRVSAVFSVVEMSMYEVSSDYSIPVWETEFLNEELLERLTEKFTETKLSPLAKVVEILEAMSNNENKSVSLVNIKVTLFR